MLRILWIGLLSCGVVFALAACGGRGGERGEDGSPLVASETEPTFEPIATYTPTPEPVVNQAELAPPASTPDTDTAESDGQTDGEDELSQVANALAAATDNLQERLLTRADTSDESEGGEPEDRGIIHETGDETGDESELSLLLAPTPTPVPGPQLQIIADAVNVRSGPGTEYALVGAAIQGARFEIVARTEQNDWWEICCIDNTTGWVFGALVEARNTEGVAEAAELPPLPTSLPTVEAAPVALVDTEPNETGPPETTVSETGPDAPQEAEPVALPVEPQPEPPAEPAPAAAPPGQPAPAPGTAGNFDPNAQYQIVHYHTRGYHDNNGGIFHRGGQQLIFLTVLDAAGNGVDGVVVKNALADNLTVVTGDKGPGKAEIKMDWDPYKLYVAQDGSGPVTSHVSNQMNNPYPHIPDIVGIMGPVDLEYAICPTAEDRCDPPFYHAHWSYEIVFQKVR